MSALRHTSGLESVLRWMTATLADAEKGGRPCVELHHVDTWRAALATIHADLSAREMAVITAEAGADPAGLIDSRAAERLISSATYCVQVLANHAKASATRSEFTEIDLAACGVIDAVEGLARGVYRPSPLQKGN